MIERFSILYAGHVDMDNIGYDGTPVNERFLSDEHLASALATTETTIASRSGAPLLSRTSSRATSICWRTRSTTHSRW